MGTWSLSGNALGTKPTGVLGTTDNNALVVETDGHERLRIDPSGNVGIGTTTPCYSLHLATGKALRLEGGTGASDSTNYFSFGGNGSFGIDAPNVPNGRFVVENSGNVGIGVPNPTSTLQVNGSLAVSPTADGALGVLSVSGVYNNPTRNNELQLLCQRWRRRAKLCSGSRRLCGEIARPDSCSG